MVIETQQLQRSVINFLGTSRREELGGRKFIVAPMTLIVPGVLDGSNGPLLYPREEVVKNPTDWNEVPIIPDHPTINNIPISADDPELLEKYKIGVIKNAEAPEDNLRAEGWFDIERTRQIAPKTLHRLLSKQKIELSTGLTGRQENVKGTTANGDSYVGVYRDYVPDHLAVFENPLEEGACSVLAGCGVNNTKHSVSHNDIKDALRNWIEGRFGRDKDGFPNAFLVSVFDKSFVYEFNDTLFRLDYTLKKDVVEVSNQLATEVQKVTDFIPVTNTKKKDKNMKTKEELITSLVANCSCWSEADTETLEGFSDEKLLSLNTAASKSQEDEKKLKEQDTMLVANKKSLEEKDVELKTLTANAKNDDDKNKEPEKIEIKLEELPELVRNRLAYLDEILAKEKTVLVTKLVDNASGMENDEQKETLTANFMKMAIKDSPEGLPGLETLVSLLPKVEEIEQQTANYSGQASPHSVTGNANPTHEPLGLPEYNYDTDENDS